MTSGQYKIREYCADDTDALIEIWRSANALAHPFLEDIFVEQVGSDMRSIYLPNAETWVLEVDGLPVGFIALLGSEIGGLFLDPRLHGQGFGKALTDHAAKLKGKLSVEVFENNIIGRRFYDRYGFVEVSRHLHEASGQNVLILEVPQE
ncbi:GNAT family N-acetyltransferase [Maritalea sp.]|jgi:putative acetyltransferase|uniref:GNAT family N-acetyltransferase n=1 Tax=Maritalea sp. TaxID=2003361 RepID=UPI0039E34D8A